MKPILEERRIGVTGSAHVDLDGRVSVGAISEGFSGYAASTGVKAVGISLGTDDAP